MARSDLLPKSSRALAMAAVCIVIAALYFGQDVLIPLAVALLLTFLLAPVVHAVERWRVPRVLAVLLVVLSSFAIIGLVLWMITNQANDLARQITTYRSEIEHKIDEVKGRFLHGALAQASQEVNRVAQDESHKTGPAPIPVIVTSPDEGTNRLLGLLSSVFSLLAPLAKSLIIVVFVIFMLIQREDLRDRVIRLIGQGQLTVTTQAIDEAGRRVSKYLLAQFIINGSFALIIGTGLYLLKIPNAPLWGLICGILRFIPYLGVWIGAVFPIILSAVVPEGSYALRPVFTIALFVAVELSVANFLEPWLYSSSTGVSSLAILVAAVFWTWLWGAAGLLLSTPLTVILAVMGKYVPQLEFLSILLGDQPVLEPHERYYQRLLADAPEEASDMIEEFQKSKSTIELFTQIMLPALQMAERDHARGVLDDGRRAFIRESIVDEIETLRVREAAGDKGKEPAPQTADKNAGAVGFVLPRDCTVNVICLPASGEADNIAGQMIAFLLQRQGYSVQAVSEDALASEMMETIAKAGANMVIVSALPPGAVAHARYLCKRIGSRFAEMPLVMGLWNSSVDVVRTKDRIGCAASVGVTNNFEDALNMVHQMIQPLLIRTPVSAGSTGK